MYIYVYIYTYIYVHELKSRGKFRTLLKIYDGAFGENS